MRKLFKGRSTERDAFRIPRSVQQSIPIKRIYKDGVFQRNRLPTEMPPAVVA